MHHQPYTRFENVETMRCGIDKLTSQGMSRRAAVRRVARRRRITPRQVSTLVAHGVQAAGWEA
jgi:hypothetical protein